MRKHSSVGNFSHRNSERGVLRTSTVEKALAERPAGLKLSALAERLGPMFDVGDVLIALNRRPDLFLKWDGRWLSRAASLDQSPRQLRWKFTDGQVPEEWRRFHNPSGAAGGWRAYRERIRDRAFDPQTTHIALSVNDGHHPGLRLHVDHTILLGRAAWVLWAVTDDACIATELEASGFFLWNQSDPRAMIDVTHRVRADRPLLGPLLTTWALRTPLELADSLAFLLVKRLGLLSPKSVHHQVDTVDLPKNDLRAFNVARRLWQRRQAGETISHCLQCGHALSDPNSAALGYGPDCAARLGLGVVRALARGHDGVLLMGALPLTAVRERMDRETAARTPTRLNSSHLAPKSHSQRRGERT